MPTFDPTTDTAADRENVITSTYLGTDYPDALALGYSPDISSFSANLHAFYPLAETSGTTINDLGPNNLDGTYSGATLDASVATPQGPFGRNYAFFDGVDDYGDLGVNIPQNIGTGDIAVSAWVNLNRSSWNGTFENVLCNDFDGTGGFGIQRWSSDSRFVVAMGGSDEASLPDSNLLDTNWHFIYAHVDDSTNESLLRVDDTTDVVSSSTNDITNETGNTHLAAQGGGSSPGESNIAHVAFWDGPLTTAEQDELRNAPL